MKSKSSAKIPHSQPVPKIVTKDSHAIHEQFTEDEMRAIKKNEELGLKSHCRTRRVRRTLQDLDGYIRRRLRVAFNHKHPSQRKGMKMQSLWNNSFFLKINLIPSYWLFLNKAYEYTKEQYIYDLTNKAKRRLGNRIKRAKEKGEEYYTPRRLYKMQNAWNAST